MEREEGRLFESRRDERSRAEATRGMMRRSRSPRAVFPHRLVSLRAQARARARWPVAPAGEAEIAGKAAIVQRAADELLHLHAGLAQRCAELEAAVAGRAGGRGEPCRVMGGAVEMDGRRGGAEACGPHVHGREHVFERAHDVQNARRQTHRRRGRGSRARSWCPAPARSTERGARARARMSERALLRHMGGVRAASSGEVDPASTRGRFGLAFGL